ASRARRPMPQLSPAAEHSLFRDIQTVSRWSSLRLLRRALALTWGAQLVLAPVTCALWVGLSMPQLQLLPGVGSDANSSVAISLQSTLLGIDDQADARKLRLGSGAVLS